MNMDEGRKNYKKKTDFLSKSVKNSCAELHNKFEDTELSSCV